MADLSRTLLPTGGAMSMAGMSAMARAAADPLAAAAPVVLPEVLALVPGSRI